MTSWRVVAVLLAAVSPACSAAPSAGTPPQRTALQLQSLDCRASELAACPEGASVQATCANHVVPDANLALVFVGNWSDGSRQTTLATWQALASGGVLVARLAEYGIHSLTVESQMLTLAANGSDESLAGELVDAIRAGSAPGMTEGRIYLFLLSSDLSTTRLTDLHASGYHAQMTWDTQTTQVAFAKGQLAYPFVTPTHELAEALTDPDAASGYRDRSITEGEVSDLCPKMDHVSGTDIAQVWSQTQCSCL
jgi:hypothetical protein